MDEFATEKSDDDEEEEALERAETGRESVEGLFVRDVQALLNDVVFVLLVILVVFVMFVEFELSRGI